MKGQLSKAIGEYQRLVEACPKDVRHRQKLAELLSRDKRNESALAEYEVVARHYAETGFYLKSIAVFKQMQKIEPARVDIYHRLAELNEKQGLIGNALTEYRNLVSFYEKDDMHHEAIEVLQKMADLDPENLVSSAKITECLMASGRTDEALAKFQEIIGALAEKEEHLKIVKLYERFLELCPEEGTSLLPLATALLKSGSAEEAIKVLKRLLKHSAEDPDIHLCLTDAYVANQDFANARLTLKHLLKQKDDDLDLHEYYVRICLDAGELERARDRLEEWKDAFIQAERSIVLQGFYEELNALLPGDSMVVEALAALSASAGDTARQNEIDAAAEASRLPDVAADAVLIDGAIDNAEASVTVGEAVFFASKVMPPGLDVPAKRSAAAGLELDLDLDFETAVAEPDNAGFISAVTEFIAEQEGVSAAELDEEVEVEVEIDLVDMDDLDLEFDEDIIAIEDEISAGQDAVEDEGANAGEMIGENGDHKSEFELYLAVESPDLIDAEETGTEEQKRSQDDIVVAGLGTEVLSGSPENFSNQAAAGKTDNFAPWPEVEEPEESELSEDFEVLEELDELEELEAVVEIDDLKDVETLTVEKSSGSDEFSPALNVETELEDADFYLHQGLYDEASTVVQNLMDAHPESAEFQVKMDEIIQERQTAVHQSERTDSADDMSDLQDEDLLAATNLLDSFGGTAQENDELSQKLVSELDSADTESHYNLGIAYKEMGLYDDAVAEFAIAAKDDARNLDCTTLTGQCYVETGETDAAMQAFKSGLAHQGITDEGRMTLNFEVGMLHQLNGQLLDALDYFQLVAEKDSFFRDVSELIKNLRRELGLDDDSNDDGGPQGNRDRVSYI
ncbi:MAG: tetratricopeptide repeat protein [Desulfuromonadales bacterium]